MRPHPLTLKLARLVFPSVTDYIKSLEKQLVVSRLRESNLPVFRSTKPYFHVKREVWSTEVIVSCSGLTDIAQMLGIPLLTASKEWVRTKNPIDIEVSHRHPGVFMWSFPGSEGYKIVEPCFAPSFFPKG